MSVFKEDDLMKSPTIPNLCVYLLVVCLPLTALTTGCGANSPQEPNSPSLRSSGESSMSTAEISSTGKTTKASSRKIVYKASLEIVVDDFAKAQKQVTQLIESLDGFVSNSRFNSLQGKKRSGTMTAKIPVEHFQAFLETVSGYGIPVSRVQEANDMTEEFVDVNARIANKRKLEERVLGLLESNSGQLEQVLKLEKELSRIREEIERMEGRVRFISEQSALTDVVLNLREEENYEPAPEPTFQTRLSDAWSSSLTNGRQLFEDTVVFLAGNIVTLAMLIVLALVAWPMIRIFRRGTSESPATEPTPSQE